jgi:hypothetical protein
MLMVSLVQIAATELALRSAVTETGKSIAEYWSPVRTVYSEAKERVAGTAAGAWTQEALSRVENARGEWTAAENWLLQYESLLPDTAVQVIQWEINKRQSLEQDAQSAADRGVSKVLNPLLCQAFQPVLRHYANPRLLLPDRLSVEYVKLPSLESGGNPYLEIVASYRLRLPVPFLNKTITLQKKSYERAWVGEE